MKTNKADTASTKKERNSNIECLRIISMLLIIAFHATRVGYNSQDADFIVYAGGQMIGSWGVLGVDLFLITSAWFLSDQNFRIKKVISIVFQTFSWVFAYSVLSVIYDFGKSRSIKYAVMNFCEGVARAIVQPLWSRCYWFVTSYVFLLIISPLLNKLLRTAPKDRVRKVLLLFIFIPLYSQFGTSVVGDIIYFAYSYLMIGYWKRYGCAFLERAAKPCYFVSVSILIAVSRLLCYIPANSFFTKILVTGLHYTTGAIGRHSMILLFDALLIFFWVIKLAPHYNRAVNRVAECTLGVYLFHENSVLSFPNMVEHIFYRLTKIGFIGTSALFPLQYLAATVLVFISGAAIEYVRDMVIQKPFMNRLTRRYSAKLETIDAWFNSI